MPRIRSVTKTIPAGNDSITHDTGLGQKVKCGVDFEVNVGFYSAVSDASGVITVTLAAAQGVDVICNIWYEKPDIAHGP